MAKPKTAAPKKRKPKLQQEIPGTERPRDDELDAAAEDLSEAGTKLSKAHERREEAAERLLALMSKKGLSVYVAEDQKLRVEVRAGKNKVRVSRLEERSADDEAAE
jgi:aspartate aminotransferase-like enzyme